MGGRAMPSKRQQTYVLNKLRQSAKQDGTTDVVVSADGEHTLTDDFQMNLFGDIAAMGAQDHSDETSEPLPPVDASRECHKVSHPRIVVAGCRDYLDTRHVECEMKKLVKRLTGCDLSADVEIIEGGARGVDTIAKNIAEKHKWTCREFKAQWCLYGRRAGPTRNAKMARYAAESEFPCLLAFWDMQSRGTGNMIRVAKKNGLDVTIIDISKKMRKK